MKSGSRVSDVLLFVALVVAAGAWPGSHRSPGFTVSCQAAVESKGQKEKRRTACQTIFPLHGSSMLTHPNMHLDAVAHFLEKNFSAVHEGNGGVQWPERGKQVRLRPAKCSGHVTRDVGSLPAISGILSDTQWHSFNHERTGAPVC